MKKSLPVLMLSALLLCTHAHAAENERTLTVRASATEEAAPDTVFVTLAVETMATEAKESAARNASATDLVIKSVKKAIGPADEVETSSFSVYPVYDFEKGRGQVLKGFRTVNQVKVTTSRIGSTGELLDRAMEAGANRVVGVSFDIKDISVQCEGLIRSAAAKAASQANAAASAFGTALDKVKTILPSCSRESEGPIRPFGAEVMKMSAAPETPIEPGMVKVRADVEAVYFLGGER